LRNDKQANHLLLIASWRKRRRCQLLLETERGSSKRNSRGASQRRAATVFQKSRTDPRVKRRADAPRWRTGAIRARPVPTADNDLSRVENATSSPINSHGSEPASLRKELNRADPAAGGQHVDVGHDGPDGLAAKYLPFSGGRGGGSSRLMRKPDPLPGRSRNFDPISDRRGASQTKHSLRNGRSRMDGIVEIGDLAARIRKIIARGGKQSIRIIRNTSGLENGIELASEPASHRFAARLSSMHAAKDDSSQSRPSPSAQETKPQRIACWARTQSQSWQCCPSAPLPAARA